MKFHILIFAVVVLGTVSQLVAQSFAKVNINNVSTFVWNDGRMDFGGHYNIVEGFEYPRESKKYAIYSSGFYWGGFFGNEIRIGGTRYETTLSPGWINNDGKVVTENSSTVFRVRPDYRTSKLYTEVNDENKSEEVVRENYNHDYNNWPVALGAPYTDVNNDGIFSSWIDTPGFPKADQTLWVVCNDKVRDGDSVTMHTFYSKQTNIELQATIWAYSKYDLLKSTIFKKYKLVNRSKTETVKEMYIAIYADSDLGDAATDLVGCDSTLGIGYIYNGIDSDYIYGNNLPVYAVILLQGAIVNGEPTDFAFSNGKKIKGKKDLGMIAFNPLLISSTADYGAPKPFNFYNTLMGLNLYSGKPFIDSSTNQATKFPLGGNPNTKVGWLDYQQYYRSNREFQISTGPFNLEPGESQEIIMAQIITSSTNRLGNIAYIKYLAKYVKDFYMNGMFPKITDVEKETELPTHFSLEQNYPNPFNPETTIRYKIAPLNLPKGETFVHVTLKVFDLLGREVVTLVNEFKQPGTYEVKLNARHFERSREIASGVYFYILQAGEYISTKKMVLLK